jgi:FtsP/CotA-like multicopper oxidase with cupredoxin domain
MFPGQVTRIVARWAPQDVKIEDAKPGKNAYSFDPTIGPGYAWHCHIVDHEDNEMMRPYIPVKTKSNRKK